MAQIPRGIQLVEWKNKHDKTKQIRYRVRVQRKDYQCDELFEDLEKAIAHLNNTKSKVAIVKMKEYDKEKEAEAKAISSFLSSPPFSFFVQKYIEKYIDSKDDGTELKKRNIQSDKSRINSILDVKIEYIEKKFQRLPTIIKSGLSHSKKRLRDFKLEEIDDVVITNYIHSRMTPLAPLDYESLEKLELNKKQKIALARHKKISSSKKLPAKSTIKREVDTLSIIFNKIRYIDKTVWIEKLKGDNPCATADLTLIKHYDKSRKARIEKDLENKILKALKEFDNKEMLLIFALAMTTGMRRSEILSLKFSQINEKASRIELSKTKSGQERSVFLTEEAKAVIKSIPRKDENLFHYKIDGFNSNWQRSKKKHHFREVQLHDTRREFISKMLEAVGSSIVVSDMIAMSDINHFEKKYSHNEIGLSSQSQVMSSAGHTRKETTKRYFKRTSK